MNAPSRFLLTLSIFASPLALAQPVTLVEHNAWKAPVVRAKLVAVNNREQYQDDLDLEVELKYSNPCMAANSYAYDTNYSRKVIKVDLLGLHRHHEDCTQEDDPYRVTVRIPEFTSSEDISGFKVLVNGVEAKLR